VSRVKPGPASVKPAGRARAATPAAVAPVKTTLPAAAAAATGTDDWESL